MLSNIKYVTKFIFLVTSKVRLTTLSTEESFDGVCLLFWDSFVSQPFENMTLINIAQFLLVGIARIEHYADSPLGGSKDASS